MRPRRRTVADKAWKRAERRVAELTGGRRLGPSGRNTADVINGWLACEVKERAELPRWLAEAVGQAVRNAPAGMLPVVILHELGRRHVDDVVMLRLGDFREWFIGQDPAGGQLAEVIGNERAT